jgi:hypothetical protein
MVLILLFSEKFQAVRISVRKINEQGTFASGLCEYSEKKSLESLILAFKALKRRKKSHFGRAKCS